MKIITLDKHQVPPELRRLRPNDRTFQVVITETVEIPSTAGLWDGGSRDLYHYVQLATGQMITPPWQHGFIDGRRQHTTVNLADGFGVVRESVFMGKKSPLTFYIRGSNAAGMLPPPPAAMSDNATKVLKIMRQYIPRARRDEAKSQGIGDDAWEAAQAELRSHGLVDSRGWVTTKGKNI